MTDRCEIPRCRGEIELIYLDHGICNRHWMELAADDAPADALRMVLGIEADTPAAMEEPMSETAAATETVAKKEEFMATTAKKTKPKAKSTAKARTTKSTKTAKAASKKAAKPKKTRPPKEDLVVFALRMTEAERTKLHHTAGPRGAARLARAVLVAAANESESGFREALREAAKLRA